MIVAIMRQMLGGQSPLSRVHDLLFCPSLGAHMIIKDDQ
jgi:hypothetical protein